MRAKAMAALGAAAYIVFLALATPASFIAARARAAAPRHLDIREAKGSIWSGSARARIAVPGGHLIFDRIEWRFVPARLLSGRIGFDVKATGHGFEGHGQLARTLTRWELRDAVAMADVEALVPLAPMAATWRPEGSLALSSPALDFDDDDARGTFAAEWRDAALSLSQVRPLGTYRLDAEAHGGPAKLTLTTVAGELQVDAQGTFTQPASLALKGEARAEGPRAQALQPLLDLIGPRRPDGARAVEIRLN